MVKNSSCASQCWQLPQPLSGGGRQQMPPERPWQLRLQHMPRRRLRRRQGGRPICTMNVLHRG